MAKKTDKVRWRVLIEVVLDNDVWGLADLPNNQARAKFIAEECLTDVVCDGGPTTVTVNAYE
jgi:hypothetical protein